MKSERESNALLYCALIVVLALLIGWLFRRSPMP